MARAPKELDGAANAPYRPGRSDYGLTALNAESLLSVIRSRKGSGVRGAPATHHLPPFTLSFSSPFHFLSLSLSLFLSFFSFYSASVRDRRRYMACVCVCVPLRSVSRSYRSARTPYNADAAVFETVYTARRCHPVSRFVSVSRESLAKRGPRRIPRARARKPTSGWRAAQVHFTHPWLTRSFAFVALVVVKATWVATWPLA